MQIIAFLRVSMSESIIFTYSKLYMPFVGGMIKSWISTPLSMVSDIHDTEEIPWLTSRLREEK